VYAVKLATSRKVEVDRLVLKLGTSFRVVQVANDEVDVAGTSFSAVFLFFSGDSLVVLPSFSGPWHLLLSL